MYCKYCGTKASEGALYCQHDGSSLLSYTEDYQISKGQGRFCSSCSCENDSNNTYCICCGSSLEEITARAASLPPLIKEKYREIQPTGGPFWKTCLRLLANRKSALYAILAIVLSLIISYIIRNFVNEIVLQLIELPDELLQKLKLISTTDVLMISHLIGGRYYAEIFGTRSGIYTTGGLLLLTIIPASILLLAGHLSERKSMAATAIERIYRAIPFSVIYAVIVAFISLFAGANINLEDPTGFAEGISLKADYSFGTSFVHALIMGFIFFVIGSQIGSVRNQGSGESHSYGTVIHRAIFSSIVGILVCVILFHSYLLLNGDLDDFKRDDVVASTQVSGYLWSLSQLNSISFTIGQPELMDYKLSLLSGLTSQSVDDSNININDIISKLRLLILVPILLHLMSGIAFRRASTTSLIKRVTGYAISFGLLQTLLVYMQNLRFYTDIGDMITADISISLFEAFVIGTLFSFIFAYAGVYIYNYFSSKQNRSY